MKKLFLIILSAFILVSCEEFLTEIPESSYNVENFYQSQNDFNQAIAAVYSSQQSLFQSNACWFRAMITRSDDTKNGAGYIDNLDQFNDDDGTNILNTGWVNLWQMISRTNRILEQIESEDVEFTDSEMKDYIKGEAYILRAYAYWTLAWQFGGMPLIDKPLTVEETKEVPRSSQEETFNFAVADYNSAIDLLPESWSSGYAGRATKYSAQAMLARLHMFRSDFQQAKPLLQEVINSNQYAMAENYTDCFSDGHDNGPERVWEVQFTGGQLGEGQWFSTGTLPERYYHPETEDTYWMPFTGWSTDIHGSENLWDSYESGDIRKSSSMHKGLVVNGIMDTEDIYVIKWTHYSYTPQDKWDWANNLPIIRYTDVKMMYAEILNEESYVSDGEAFDIINEVRDRAGLEPLTSNEIPDQDSFREALIQERRWEFAFEARRWVDLVRWGIAEEVMNEHFLHEDEGEGRYKMEPHQTLFAIPFDALSRYNDEDIMWQNPGY